MGTTGEQGISTQVSRMGVAGVPTAPGREGSNSLKSDPTPSTPFSLFLMPFKERGKEGLLKSCFPSCRQSNT